jgi:hypothetical protein
MNLTLPTHKYLFHYFLIICLLGIYNDASATHLMGSDISFQKIGLLKYKVTYKLYRECSGVPLNGLVFKIHNSSKSDSIVCTRISIKDISLKCSKDTNPCTPSNSTSNQGVEEHVYVRVLDFSSGRFASYNNLNDCFLSFSVETCCRDGAITTISPGNYYSESKINLCLAEQVSFNEMKFTSYPIQYLCCNNSFSYSNGIIFNASQTDSLSFSLDTPLNAKNSYEQYNSGFSAQKPLTTLGGQTGFKFEIDNGDFIITPTSCSQVGVIVIKCKNWYVDSNGNRMLLAEYRREFELIVKNCAYDNFAPYFIGSNNYSICEGDKLCLNITSKDDPYLPKQTNLDTIDISYKTNIPNVELALVDSNAREKIVTICWQSVMGDSRISPYFLTLRADDDKCGNPMYGYKNISIKVKPRPKVRREYTFLSNGRLKMESLPFGNSVNQGDYIFTIYDSLGQIKYNSLKKLDTFQFNFPGKYVIYHRVNDTKHNCPVVLFDTIIITQEFLNSISSNRVFKELSFYPNPGNGKYSILTSIDLNLDHELYLYNNFGQLIKAIELKSTQFDLSELNSGTYYIQIVSETSLYSGKLILIK